MMLLIYCVLWFLSCSSLLCMEKENTITLLQEFMKANRLFAAVAFTCWEMSAQRELIKTFAERSLRIKVFGKHGSPKNYDVLSVKYNHLAVIVDLECTGAYQHLAEASKRKFFKGLHFWLLLTNSVDTFNSSDSKTQDRLESMSILLDSHVTVTHLGEEVDQVILRDVYKLRERSALTVTPPLPWRPGEKYPLAPQRDDFHQAVVKSAVTVIDDPWEHFLDLNYRHLNTMSKLSYVLTCYLAEMLNFRMDLVFTDAWGFPLNNSDQYSGVAGLLQRGDVEIGATTLLIKPARLNVLDYAAEAFPFVGNFMFLRPSLSEVSNIYLLPFTETVWLVIVALVALLTVALAISLRVHNKLEPAKYEYKISWNDSIMNTLGIVCQQGNHNSPDEISSRIAFLFLLLLSLFLVASYSAIIVSLLQTSSRAIHTVEDLMNSQFQLSMRNITYSITYVNDTNDPIVKRLYFEKLYTQPFSKAFTSQEIGIANVKKGLHAFQGDADAYKVMSDILEPHEKCRYEEINLFVTNVLAYPVRKHSQFKEIIARKARWLREIGFTNREYLRWYHQKPKCNDNSHGFVSVRIQDFYPALLVFAYGAVISVVVLILEIILHYGIQIKPTSNLTVPGSLLRLQPKVFGTKDKQAHIPWLD